MTIERRNCSNSQRSTTVTVVEQTYAIKTHTGQEIRSQDGALVSPRIESRSNNETANKGDIKDLASRLDGIESALAATAAAR
jgi:hypothetical protein